MDTKSCSEVRLERAQGKVDEISIPLSPLETIQCNFYYTPFSPSIRSNCPVIYIHPISHPQLQTPSTEMTPPLRHSAIVFKNCQLVR